MEHLNGNPSPPAATPECEPASKPYQPPTIEWEEEFEPVAASPCDPLDPQCQP